MMTVSFPLSRWTTIAGFAARFRASADSAPVPKKNESSTQTPQTGIAGGRPSGRVVEIQ
jgi:hypothetical protein